MPDLSAVITCDGRAVTVHFVRCGGEQTDPKLE
jgi:hypothetical protein